VKTFLIAAFILIVLTGAGYFYTRHGVLKAKDFKPDNTKAESIIDLRPSIIAKLQQLVKDGSNGLYILSVEKIEPDILSSKLDVIDGSIIADTAAIYQLDLSKQLPDDIFKIKFHALHMDGFGIEDILHKDKIDIANIHLSEPVIEVYHKSRKYNEKEKAANQQLTIYQRLKNQIKKIAIGKINIDHGKLILYNSDEKNHSTVFNDITINMGDVLMDSSTQYEKERFLFAKHAKLEARNYVVGTPDSLYKIKLGSISVTSETNKITILNAELKPNGGKKQFVKKLKGREEMYDVTTPKIVFSGVDWWALLNREKVISTTMDINGGEVNVFFDRSLPPAVNEPMNHFPHQLVMMIPYPVMVNKLNVHDLKVVYTQYNPETRSTGTATITNINAVANHVTNIPAEVKKYPFTDISTNGLFMGKTPLHVKFKLDLLQYRTGKFSAEVRMGELNKDLVNPISEPLGRFTVKRGRMHKGDAHITGDNSRINGTIAFYYDDLHLTPLREDSANGHLIRNHVKSFFANWILLKNSNPGNKFRSPGFSVVRDGHQNFVGFIWTSITVGILKTIGAPEKLAMKKQ
jgi:hypothetical protein